MSKLIARGNVGVPPLDPSVVDRPRLVRALLSHVERERIVHIVGVAGAGKTTAAVQVARASSIPVGWVTVEAWDVSPARFLADLGMALGDAVPGVRKLVDHGAYQEPAELAAAVGGLLGTREVLLVVDEAHLLTSRPAALLGALLRTSAGLRLLLVGRSSVAVPGAGVDLVARSVEIGDDLLAVDLDEASEILAARASDGDPETAVRVSGGWVAGIVFESVGGFGTAASGLSSFLDGDVRPQLSQAEDAFLLTCAVVDRVDPRRAVALGGENGPDMLAALRRAGLPGVWSPDGALRMHPRIREHLRAELETGNAARRREALAAAARAYEQEGQLELSLESCLQADLQDDARRLLPLVIEEIVSRLDLEQARRLLAEVAYEDEPAAVLRARLSLATLTQELEGALPVLAALEDGDRFARVVAEDPSVVPLAIDIATAVGRVGDALAWFQQIPRGRARDVARYYLSTERDDPDAPIPPFVGDILDGLICTGLWYRGRLADLQQISSPVLAAVSGLPELVSRAGGGHQGPLAVGLARLAEAISTRDLAAARAVTTDFEALDSGSNIFLGLAEAEIAIRIERDAAGGLRGLARARALPEAANVSYREWIETLEAAAHLLAGDDRAARDALGETIASMRRGDRLLHLPTALVYLAEALWRADEEDAADRATAEAYALAREHAGIPRLLLAFADFPGVLSRAIDLETLPDGELRALGRALVGRAACGGSPSSPAVLVHVRELGEPAIVHRGASIRPKIRKSIELLSYLVSRPGAGATRAEALDALWNGRDDDSTRAYLRQALRHLRDALPDGVTVATRDDLLVVEGAVSSESGEIEALLSQAALQPGGPRRALLLEMRDLLSRGAFLAGSEGVVWIDDRRERLRSMLADVRLDLADLALQAESYVEALHLVDEALADDQLLERGWRIRMRTLSMLGDVDGVLSAYRACHEALSEIGLEPSRATTELARHLRS
jgi:DNA-binding SARP family transcriptional activator